MTAAIIINNKSNTVHNCFYNNIVLMAIVSVYYLFCAMSTNTHTHTENDFQCLIYLKIRDIFDIFFFKWFTNTGNQFDKNWFLFSWFI